MVEAPHLALDDRDWFRATWRTLVPLVGPTIGDADGAHLSVEAFRRAVVPSLGPAERDRWRAGVRKRLPPEWPGAPEWGPPAVGFLQAAALGLQPEVDELVASWPDAHFAQSWLAEAGFPQEIVLGQSSAALVDRHMRRLKLPLRTPDQVRAWLANTELASLDSVAETILSTKGRSNLGPMIRALGLARCEETARLMVELAVGSKDPKTPREWLERWPQYSVGPLIEISRSRGKAAVLAQEVLRAIGRGKHAAMVVDVLPATAAAGRAIPEMAPAETPPWLVADAPPARNVWPPFEELPPLVLGERRLGHAQGQVVLAALRASTFLAPHPLIAQLKAAAEPSSLDRFVCRLLELWEAQGLPKQNAWVAVAAGLCGRERAALVLGRSARPWRQDKRHAAAALAIDALAALGNDVALGELRKFSQVPRDWMLVSVAASHLTRVAAERGLSAEDLEDRTVPDCGLDAKGSCVFDFGPRRFQVSLGAGDQPPKIRDGARLRADLPVPNASDDPAKAQAAVDAWKLLKKSLPAVLRAARARLEAAMCSGRGWRAADFETCLVRHPAVGHLTRGLLWSRVRSPAAGCFRVAEDTTWAGPDDAPLVLDPDERIELVHPLLLSPDDLAAWVRRFADYELIQPFPQLGRPTTRFEAAEGESDSLDRSRGIPCMAVALDGGLVKLGWQRNGEIGGGRFDSHLRTLRGITAIVSYEPGIYMGDPRGSPDQTLESCRFFGSDSGQPLKLRDVDPVVFSEVAQDLARLTAR